jgi:hypothetical protein
MSDLNLTSFSPLYPMRIHQYDELFNDQNASVMDRINSIIDYLNQVGKLTNDVVKNWNTVYQWAMNDGLTTDVNDKLEQMKANGDFNALVSTVVALVGDLTTLTTSQKDTVVHAINSLKNDLTTSIGLKSNDVDLNTIKQKVGVDLSLSPYNLTDGSTNFSTIFNQAMSDMSAKGGGIIIVPNGTFYATDYLKLKSYCHVYLSPKTNIVMNANLYSLWINGNPSQTYSEYGAEHDFSITGNGIITINQNINTGYQGSCFGFADGKNILIEDITIRHVMYAHGFDMSGCQNVIIRNVKFLGFYDNSSDQSRGNSDAIQISNMVRTGFSLFGSFQGSPCTEITIEKCTFDKSDIDLNFVAWGVGVGNHGLAVGGRECNKIYIKNNKFLGCSYVAIHMWGWTSVYVTDLNYFENCYADISMSNVQTYQGDGVTLTGTDKGCDNIVISHLRSYGCKNVLFGIYVGTHNVYNSNITISNVEVRNAGVGTSGIQVNATYVKDLLIDNFRAFSVNNPNNMMYIQSSIGVLLNNIIGRGTNANITSTNANTNVTKGLILLDGTNS